RGHMAWLRQQHIRVLILDESHAIKNDTSKLAQVVVPFVHGIRRALFLTATSMDRPSQLFNQVEALRSGLFQRREYMFRYCAAVERRTAQGFPYLEIKGVNRSYLPELHRILTDKVMIRVTQQTKHDFEPKRAWSRYYTIVAPRAPECQARLSQLHELACFKEVQTHNRVMDFWKREKIHTKSLLGMQQVQPQPMAGSSSASSVPPSSAASSASVVQMIPATFTRVLLHVESTIEVEEKTRLVARELLHGLFPTRLRDVRYGLACRRMAHNACDDFLVRTELRTKLHEEMLDSRKKQAELKQRMAENPLGNFPAQFEGLQKLERLSNQCSRNAIRAYCTHFVRKYILPDTCRTNKVIIFGHNLDMTTFLWDCLYQILPEERRTNGMIRFDSTIPQKARLANHQQFQTDPNCQIALVGQASGGTGIEWVAANLVISIYTPWNWSSWTQMLGRVVDRLSQLRKVMVFMLTLNDSHDTIKWQLIVSKGRTISMIQDGRELKFVYDVVDYYDA